jgi:nucleoside-diphosphate-sugar epimerase
MRTQNILITGGSGDLGRVLTPRLRVGGNSVTCLDPSPPLVDGAEWRSGSILDRPLVKELVGSSDLIVHIAAWHGYHAFTQSKSAEEFWDLNMTGTFNLLEACAAHEKRKFVYISSTSVDEWPEMYGTTKLLGEELCRSYALRHQMQILALRPRAFIPWWNTQVYKSITEWGSWFARGAVHINDVASAVEHACKKVVTTNDTLFEVVEIDGKHDFSDEDKKEWIRDGAKLFLMNRFPEHRELLSSASFLPEQPPTYKDNAKARELLGFEPSYGYGELLADLQREASLRT